MFKATQILRNKNFTRCGGAFLHSWHSGWYRRIWVKTQSRLYSKVLSINSFGGCWSFLWCCCFGGREGDKEEKKTSWIKSVFCTFFSKIYPCLKLIHINSCSKHKWDYTHKILWITQYKRFHFLLLYLSRLSKLPQEIPEISYILYGCSNNYTVSMQKSNSFLKISYTKWWLEKSWIKKSSIGVSYQ